uniref:Protein kinase domain-containing protein n=1 Tax=Amphimedon queenslandica TaxID=400682 RepID=A0A1X7SUB4_AMPQE
ESHSRFYASLYLHYLDIRFDPENLLIDQHGYVKVTDFGLGPFVVLLSIWLLRSSSPSCSKIGPKFLYGSTLHEGTKPLTNIFNKINTTQKLLDGE